MKYFYYLLWDSAQIINFPMKSIILIPIFRARKTFTPSNLIAFCCARFDPKLCNDTLQTDFVCIIFHV